MRLIAVPVVLLTMTIWMNVDNHSSKGGRNVDHTQTTSRCTVSLYFDLAKPAEHQEEFPDLTVRQNSMDTIEHGLMYKLAVVTASYKIDIP
jgi:hypothetical protein